MGPVSVGPTGVYIESSPESSHLGSFYSLVGFYARRGPLSGHNGNSSPHNPHNPHILSDISRQFVAQ